MANPCGASSLPFWKEKQIVVPDNILILHDKDFHKNYLIDYNDEPYFRLKHNLIEVNQPVLPNGFELCDATLSDFAKHINKCYKGSKLTVDELESYCKRTVYYQELWIAVKDCKNNKIIGTGIAELDTEIGDGFAMVFKWADGDCMGRMYPTAHRRFMQLPINDRLTVFSDILSFLECVALRNYVAIDFYDGSIMYDFSNGKTTICDIDLFRKQPCVNDMGRMWGSSRFQSPEEYQLGSDIDEITNVYTLGATAFALFGEYNRTRDKWQLSDKLFEIATRAVSDDRAHRQQTIRQFKAEWEAAQ